VKNLVGCFIVLLTACESEVADKPDSQNFRIAVASNFFPAMTALKPELEQTCGIDVSLISGASSVLYQQIVMSAPFDLFLSADESLPELLSQSNTQTPYHIPFQYAQGELVFYAPNHVFKSADITQIQSFSRIVKANGKTAPYGRAAAQVLSSMAYNGQLITANNVAQSFQFIDSGAVVAGFVAKSLLPVEVTEQVFIPLSLSLYDPILQFGILVSGHGKGSCVANFLQQTSTQNSLNKFGYITKSATDNSTEATK
jgi:molybdate transport system substrate-binding protein